MADAGARRPAARVRRVMRKFIVRLNAINVHGSSQIFCTWAISLSAERIRERLDVEWVLQNVTTDWGPPLVNVIVLKVVEDLRRAHLGGTCIAIDATRKFAPGRLERSARRKSRGTTNRFAKVAPLSIVIAAHASDASTIAIRKANVRFWTSAIAFRPT